MAKPGRPSPGLDDYLYWQDRLANREASGRTMSLSTKPQQAIRTPSESQVANYIAIALVTWFCLAIVYALTVGLSFPTLFPMLAVPGSIGLWLMFTPSVSRILSAIPLPRLIALSFYRVAGIIFVYCYYSCGTLSRGFALNAGWGDVFTGVLAAPVAWAVWKRMPYAGVTLVIWSLIGIGDLILAPASAAIYGAEKLVDFPINLIPLFLGPPFGILLHIVTLRAAWLQRSHWTQQPTSLEQQATRFS